MSDTVASRLPSTFHYFNSLSEEDRKGYDLEDISEEEFAVFDEEIRDCVDKDRLEEGNLEGAAEVIKTTLTDRSESLHQKLTGEDGRLQNYADWDHEEFNDLMFRITDVMIAGLRQMCEEETREAEKRATETTSAETKVEEPASVEPVAILSNTNTTSSKPAEKTTKEGKTTKGTKRQANTEPKKTRKPTKAALAKSEAAKAEAAGKANTPAQTEVTTKKTPATPRKRQTKAAPAPVDAPATPASLVGTTHLSPAPESVVGYDDEEIPGDEDIMALKAQLKTADDDFKLAKSRKRKAVVEIREKIAKKQAMTAQVNKSISELTG